MSGRTGSSEPSRLELHGLLFTEKEKYGMLFGFEHLKLIKSNQTIVLKLAWFGNQVFGTIWW